RASFVIDDLPGPTHQAEERTWVFRYRLKPRNANVTEVPALRFDYYRPGMIPPEKGYQATYTKVIPLTVKPRSSVEATEARGPSGPPRLPEAFYQVGEAPAAVLRQEEPFTWPGPLSLAVLLLLPPALCAGWYGLWHRRYPDAARLARQRQSRAARQALHAL